MALVNPRKIVNGGGKPSLPGKTGNSSNPAVMPNVGGHTSNNGKGTGKGC